MWSRGKLWGMWTQAILTTLLAARPAPPDIAAPDFSPDSVEIYRGAIGGEVVAYDAKGEVLATIVVWSERVDESNATPEIHLATYYDDGWSEITMVDGEVASYASTLPTAVLEDRALAIKALVGEPPETWSEDGSWLECGAYSVLSAAEFAHGNIFLGGASAVLAYCACAKKIEKLPECW